MNKVFIYKIIKGIILVLACLPGIIFLINHFFPQKNNKDLLIKKVYSFYIANIDTLNHSIRIIDTVNIGSNNFAIHIAPKHPQFRIEDYENYPKNKTNWNFKGKDFIEAYIRKKNISIFTEKGNIDTTYSFYLFNIKDCYGRSAELIHKHISFTNNMLQNSYIDYEVVKAPTIPIEKDGWIYVLDNHWFIKMEKYKPDKTDDSFSIIFWSIIVSIIVLFQIRKLIIWRNKTAS
jgi:hypothetical protein